MLRLLLSRYYLFLGLAMRTSFLKKGTDDEGGGEGRRGAGAAHFEMSSNYREIEGLAKKLIILPK